MIKIKKSPDWFEFQKPLLQSDPFKGGVQDSVQWIIDRSYDAVSIVLIVEDVRDDLRSNARYIRQHFKVDDCLVVAEAKRRVKDRCSETEMKRIARRLDVPMQGNTGRVDDDYQRSYLESLKSAYELGKAISVVPQILYEYKTRYQFDSAKRGETVDAFKVDEGGWEQEIMKLLFPRVVPETKRLFRMPEPLDRVVEGVRWAQWYFISRESTIDCVYGSDVESGRQERYGSIFGALDRKGMHVPTFVFRLDNQNRFKYDRQFERFRGVGLSGDDAKLSLKISKNGEISL